MTKPLKVLVDLNVVLDVLQKREPHYADSARLLAFAETGILEAFMAAHSWTTLFYLFAKDKSAELARVHLTELLQFLSVAAVDQAVVEQALNLPYKDFEDAVQMMAAVRAGADVLVRRNVRDFKAGPLRVLQPGELAALIES